ncbi:MAG TPA: kelch repeat-containing protein, partial [Chitinophagaceae bacterium]|nr:kelch repeat-containing protein [Chitinophagaceae bacterium]
MKLSIAFSLAVVFLVEILFSCKKESVSPTRSYKPPLANAGEDILVIYPNDTAILNGSRTTADDPIFSYKWSKLSGPDSFTIVDSNAPITAVKNLVPGFYQFQLRVVDNYYRSSVDTVKVSVKLDRLQINVSVTPLSMVLPYAEGRTVAANGNKILFAGGYSGSTIFPTVYIYDNRSGAWSLKQLSEPRAGMVAAVLGNKFFFAGGATKYELTWDDAVWTNPSKRIDIYDASSDSWSTTELPIARSFLHAAVSGNKIFFGGGSTIDSGRVDILDVSSNSWSIVALDPPRAQMAVASAGDLVFFAGGLTPQGIPLSELDILNISTNNRIVDALSTGWYNITAVASASSVFLTGQNISPGFSYNRVDIF